MYPDRALLARTHNNEAVTADRYDWRGRRIFRSILEIFKTYYVYDQADRLIAEYALAVSADLSTVTVGPRRGSSP